MKKKFIKYLRKTDVFGRNIELTLKQKKTHQTLFGTTLTICVVIATFLGSRQLGSDFLVGKNPNMFYKESFFNSESNIYDQWKELEMRFSIQDSTSLSMLNGQQLVQSNKIQISVSYIPTNSQNQQTLQIKWINNGMTFVIADEDLEQMTNFQNIRIQIKGQNLSSYIISTNYRQFLFSPDLYENPFISSYQSSQLLLNNSGLEMIFGLITVNTDRGSVQVSYYQQQCLQYQQTLNIQHSPNAEPNTSYFLISLSSIETEYTRKYLKVQGLIAIIGGLLSSFLVVGRFLSKPIVELSLRGKLLGQLFNFAEFESLKQSNGLGQSSQFNKNINDDSQNSNNLGALQRNVPNEDRLKNDIDRLTNNKNIAKYQIDEEKQDNKSYFQNIENKDSSNNQKEDQEQKALIKAKQNVFLELQNNIAQTIFKKNQKQKNNEYTKTNTLPAQTKKPQKINFGKTVMTQEIHLKEQDIDNAEEDNFQKKQNFKNILNKTKTIIVQSDEQDSNQDNLKLFIEPQNKMDEDIKINQQNQQILTTDRFVDIQTTTDQQDSEPILENQIILNYKNNQDQDNNQNLLQISSRPNAQQSLRRVSNKKKSGFFKNLATDKQINNTNQDEISESSDKDKDIIPSESEKNYVNLAIYSQPSQIKTKQQLKKEETYVQKEEKQDRKQQTLILNETPSSQNKNGSQQNDKESNLNETDKGKLSSKQNTPQQKQSDNSRLSLQTLQRADTQLAADMILTNARLKTFIKISESEITNEQKLNNSNINASVKNKITINDTQNNKIQRDKSGTSQKKLTSTEMKQFDKMIEQKQTNTLKLGFFDYIKYFLYKKDKKKNQIEYCMKKVAQRLDIDYILNKLVEIDKLKMLLLDHNQRELFEFLPRPVVLQKENGDINEINEQFNIQEAWNLLQEEKNTIDKATNACISYKIMTQKKKKNVLDSRLLEMLDINIKHVFNQTKIPSDIIDEKRGLSENEQNLNKRQNQLFNGLDSKNHSEQQNNHQQFKLNKDVSIKSPKGPNSHQKRKHFTKQEQKQTSEDIFDSCYDKTVEEISNLFNEDLNVNLKNKTLQYQDRKNALMHLKAMQFHPNNLEKKSNPPLIILNNKANNQEIYSEQVSNQIQQVQVKTPNNNQNILHINNLDKQQYEDNQNYRQQYQNQSSLQKKQNTIKTDKRVSFLSLKQISNSEQNSGYQKEVHQNTPSINLLSLQNTSFQSDTIPNEENLESKRQNPYQSIGGLNLHDYYQKKSNTLQELDKNELRNTESNLKQNSLKQIQSQQSNQSQSDSDETNNILATQISIEQKDQEAIYKKMQSKQIYKQSTTQSKSSDNQLSDRMSSLKSDVINNLLRENTILQINKDNI